MAPLIGRRAGSMADAPGELPGRSGAGRRAQFRQVLYDCSDDHSTVPGAQSWPHSSPDGRAVRSDGPAGSRPPLRPLTGAESWPVGSSVFGLVGVVAGNFNFDNNPFVIKPCPFQVAITKPHTPQSPGRPVANVGTPDTNGYPGHRHLVRAFVSGDRPSLTPSGAADRSTWPVKPPSKISLTKTGSSQVHIYLSVLHRLHS